MYKLFIYHFLIGNLTFNLLAQTPNIQTTHYTVLNGLPSQTVYNSIEDQYGFLWIATDAGVSRFDGNKFINYTTDDNLGANEILELYEDSKGRIWFLPFFGGISYYANGIFYNSSNSALIKSLKISNTIRHIIEDKDGYIYIQSISIPNVLTVITPKDSIIYLNSNTLHIDTFNVISIFLNDNQKFTFLSDKGKFYNIKNEKLYLDTLLTNNFTRAQLFFSSNRNQTFYFDQEGIKIMQQNNVKILLPRSKIYNPEKLLAINLDQNYNLWLSFTDNRTVVYNQENNTYVNGSTILNGIQANICFGNTPIAWLCSSTNGLIKIPLLSLQKSNFFLNANTISENVNSIYLQNNNTIWVGYTNGYVTQFSNSKIRHFNLNLGTRDYNRILEISEDKAGNTYFISDEAACRINKDNKLEFLRGLNYLSGGKGLCKSPKGYVYFSKYTNLDGFKDQFPDKYSQREAVLKSRRFSHAIDNQDNIYVSTSEGIYYITEDSIRNLGMISNSLNCRVNKFLVLPNNDIVLATYGNGLIILRDQTILQTMGQNEGLQGIVCRYPYLYKDSIFVATHSGIALIIPHQDKYKLVYNYTSADGLISDNVNCVFVKDYKLYSSSSKGISIIDLTKLNNKKINQHHTLIQSILINGKEYKISDKISLPYSNYHIQLQFVTPNLPGDKSLIYRYKLLPQDKEWNSTNSTTLDFSNLEPNKYKVMLQSKFTTSDWSYPIEINFTILKPFYSTWLFRVSLASLLLLGIFQIFKYYSKQKYEQALQDAKMKEAVHQERDRIASDIHDDLGADLTNMFILTQMLKSEKNESKENLITTLENRLNEIINKMNEVIWSLNYSNDQLNSLMAYIRLYVQTFSEQSKLNINLNIDPSINIKTAVSALIRRNVFLTIKEFINNSVKHSEAKNMTINLYFKDSSIFAELFDDGLGIEYKENFHFGNGILNMKKRINALDGSIQFISNIPKGLKLIFKVPVK